MSFRLKIILGIVVIQALLLVILISISLNFLRLSNEIELSKRAFSLANLFSVTVKPMLSPLNQSEMKSLSNTIYGQSGVVYARILDTSRVLMTAGNPDYVHKPFVEDFMIDDVTDGVFDTYAEIVENGKVLGRVEIGLSVAEIASVIEAARRQISTVALIGMTFSILMAILLGNYFARQLKTLRDAARSIASGNIGYQLYIRGQDELAQTANAFNTMSRKLALLYSEKQAALNNAENNASDLRENERRIQSILNHAMDGIITIDELGYIDTFNPAAEKIFNYSQAEVLGQSVTMLMPERMRGKQEAFLQDYMGSEGRGKAGVSKERRREFVGRRADGDTFPMEMDISEMQFEGRSLYIGIVRDVTERKNVEAELRDAKDLALESARAKFEFIANVSHELRDPMKGVLSTLNMLSHTPLSDLQREYVGQIDEAGDTLVTIVNDILDFSRLESGQLKLESLGFDLHQTVENVCQTLRPVAQRKNIQLTYFIPCLVPTALQGDPARLRQVLMNLVDNAVKYTDSGDVVLRIDVLDDADDKVTLKFSVIDTGRGLSLKAQRRIFSGYFASDHSTQVHRTGTGLGLAISKRLVDMMGGEIGVESERGKGSTFWFDVPLIKQVGSFERDDKGIDELHGLKVLIVDSRSAWREFLHNLVEAAGMQVESCESAMSALEILTDAAEDEKPYDLVVLDRLLSDMSGIDLAGRICHDSDLSTSRLIMVATTGYRGDSEAIRECGVSGYLTAPIKKSQLYECMREVMHMPLNSGDLVTRHSLADLSMSGRGQVLIVDENRDEQKDLLGLIEDLEYRPSFACSSHEAIEAIGLYQYECVIIDCEMECHDHFAVTDFIRDQMIRYPDRFIKVIALTRSDTVQSEIDECMAHGVIGSMLGMPLDRELLKAQLSA